MANVTIDGITAEVPDGLNLIKAAEHLGIHIPHFCYHENLSLVGQCRLCLVEVEPIPKLQTACSTFVKDGMVVHTDNAKVRKARAGVMEFLLINHPLDCPECDQAGECKLQDYAFECGTCHSRFSENKRTFPRDVNVGEKIVRIMDRCVHCTRCIRYFREVVGQELMTLEYRGNNTSVTPLAGASIDTMYSGNLAELCPVGALTLKDFRFKTRPWNLTTTASVCPLCSTGCNIYIDTKDNKILRIRNRFNSDVNGRWLCDEGRLGYKFVNADNRLAAPRVAGKDINWDDALKAAADGLRAVAKEYGDGALAAVCSASLTNEEIFIYKKIAGILGIKNGDYKLNDMEADSAAREDNILRRLDKSPNTSGIRAICSGVEFEARGSKLAEKILQGDVKALILINPSDKALASDLEKLVPQFGRIKCLVVMDHTETAASKAATVVLPSATFAEKSGTFTNFAGKVQRIAPALKLPGAAKTDLDILLGLAAALGSPLPYKSDIDVYKEIKDILLSLEEKLKAAKEA